jgi:hypothetical protein
MQPRTLLLKHIILLSVAAMFFVASPPFAQQKSAPSSDIKTKEVRVAICGSTRGNSQVCSKCDFKKTYHLVTHRLC